MLTLLIPDSRKGGIAFWEKGRLKKRGKDTELTKETPDVHYTV